MPPSCKPINQSSPEKPSEHRPTSPIGIPQSASKHRKISKFVQLHTLDAASVIIFVSIILVLPPSKLLEEGNCRLSADSF
jgi:hypothetical protein